MHVRVQLLDHIAPSRGRCALSVCPNIEKTHAVPSPGRRVLSIGPMQTRGRATLKKNTHLPGRYRRVRCGNPNLPAASTQQSAASAHRQIGTWNPTTHCQDCPRWCVVRTGLQNKSVRGAIYCCLYFKEHDRQSRSDLIGRAEKPTSTAFICKYKIQPADRPNDIAEGSESNLNIGKAASAHHQQSIRYAQ